jgi:crossover junction endodeoxyribonuclease RuvC
MRVLGVDPGLTRCGLGVVDGMPGRALTMVRTGVARTSPDAGIGDRLLAIEQQVEEWLVACRPDAVAVERVFSQHNVRTVMGTAQAGAVAIVCAARHGIPVALHTPSEVKAAVTGNGRADKAQVTAMVTRLLRLADPPHPADAADALALAICHIWRGAAQTRLAAAQTRATQVMAQARAAQARADQAGGSRAGAAAGGGVQAEPGPVRAAQERAAQVRAAQVRAAQVRAAQVRAAQERAETVQAATRPGGWGQAGRGQAGGPR